MRQWSSSIVQWFTSTLFLFVLSGARGTVPTIRTSQIDLQELGRDYYHPSLSSSSSSSSSNMENKPIIKSTINNITVGPGERAVLRCKVENLGTKTVTWRKEDDIHPLTIGAFPFAPDSRMSVDHNTRSSEWSLIIHDVKPSDEGMYRCQISTKNGKHSQAIKLNVKTIRVTGSEYVEKGSTIQLTCNVTGKPDPPHTIDWFKGEEKVIADAAKGIIITKKIETRVLVGMLTIKNSQPSDSGEYTCQSSDRESSSITVHVLNVPNPGSENGESTNERSNGRFFFKNEAGSRLSAPSSIFVVFFFFIFGSNFFPFFPSLKIDALAFLR